MSSDSLAEIFARDPLAYKEGDIKAIIARYREARAQFNLGVAGAGATKKVSKAEPKVKDLDLDDLLAWNLNSISRT